MNQLMPPTWIEISRPAFMHNLTAYQRLVGPDNLLTVVIKGNAYGHGLELIAQLCHEHAAVYGACTVSLSEAIAARAHMPHKFILVLSTLDADPIALIKHNIDIIVYDAAMLMELNDFALKRNAQINVHLKIDTGMSRFGFSADEGLRLIANLHTMPGIKLNGICTHFAESSSDDQTFTLQQQKKFADFLDDAFNSVHPEPVEGPQFIHSGNSGGALMTRTSRCNLVRLGSGAYGLWPSNACKKLAQQIDPTFTLQPVLTWKTRIMNIKTVPANTSISYDRSFVTQRQTKIAILPIGYWDGYDRKLSNKGWVRIRDTYAPVIGRVCMNATLVDITKIPDALVGDVVTLLGKEEKISAYTLAALTEGAHREILTRLNASVLRFFL